MRVAAVDDLDGTGLRAVRIFEWDGSYDIPASRDPKFPVFLKHIGLSRGPDRWVDISARPDIQEGEPFPFVARHLRPEKSS